MTTIVFNKDIVARILGEPTLYSEFPFLQKVKDPALRLAMAMQKASCKPCARNALNPAINAMSGAMTRLLVDESAKPDNQLKAFKDKLIKILNSPADEVRVSYTDEKGAVNELIF